MPKTAALPLLLALLTLAGCAHGAPSRRAAGAPDRSLAKAADPLSSTTVAGAPDDAATATASTPSSGPATAPTPAASGGTASPAAGGPTSAPTDAATTRASQSAAPSTTEAKISDPRGDVDALAPGYADIVSVTATSSSSLRVAVELAGSAPRVLASGEVIGLGIDIFKTGGKESDYQLFADAGSDGWVAYLQTPKGFVKYPGTFQQGGTSVVFEVPWDSLGGRTAVSLSAFLDWSREGVAVNPSSSDSAPDTGRADLPA